MSKVFYLINFVLNPMLIWYLNFWKGSLAAQSITLEISGLCDDTKTEFMSMLLPDLHSDKPCIT